jgi:hypothetical protein
VRAQQTVSEMVVEALARQAQVLSERSGQPFEEAFEEVLKTPAGYRMADLADGPHRHEKAAKWQAGLLADRQAQRRAHLRISENGYGTREGEGGLRWQLRAVAGSQGEVRSYQPLPPQPEHKTAQ